MMGAANPNIPDDWIERKLAEHRRRDRSERTFVEITADDFPHIRHRKERQQAEVRVEEAFEYLEHAYRMSDDDKIAAAMKELNEAKEHFLHCVMLSPINEDRVQEVLSGLKKLDELDQAEGEG